MLLFQVAGWSISERRHLRRLVGHSVDEPLGVDHGAMVSALTDGVAIVARQDRPSNSGTGHGGHLDLDDDRHTGQRRRDMADIHAVGIIDLKSRIIHEWITTEICYDTALATGWPIATGLIEGAARHLIADRLEITGSRWGLTGAEAILRLRALIGIGDFPTYWNHHLTQEHQRGHPNDYQHAA
ncbi:hypothetical protein HPY32_11030 [Nocardia terpenica]|nr:hypothetical protein [Nocardia terpenica]